MQFNKLCAGFFTGAAFIVICTMAPALAFAQTAGSNAGIEAQVQSYFADIPVMVAIADCESGFRQFNANGSPLIGGNGYMVGIFQIDETVWRAPALALGFDIDTVSGNMAYARLLYGQEGTEPWISSFPCWQSAAASTATAASGTGATTTTTPPTATTPSSTLILTKNLSLGMIDPQVLTLQQTLNEIGFTLAPSGPGSPGNETTKFGALTWAAVKNFQCAENITCSGDEATTGYGFVNAQTRAALLAAVAAKTAETTTSTATTATTTATSTTANQDQLAEVAQLKSQIIALTTIIAQLEAEITAKLGHGN